MSDIQFNIPNEWAPLETVVVGHGRNMGPMPNLDTAFDPTTKWHLAKGTFPDQAAVAAQLDGLTQTLENAGVRVLRPIDLDDVEQIFARDVGLVIDQTFIQSRTIDERSAEWRGVAPLLTDAPWVTLPDDVNMEGGDVVVLDGAIVVGITRNPAWQQLQVARTSPSAMEFLSGQFPEREVIGVELLKDDRDPLACALHLDCAYMPLGLGQAIICPDFFADGAELAQLESRHSAVFPISREEGALLQSNLLHLSPDTLLIDPGFKRLAGILKAAGYHLIECPMDLVGRMGGLFRCTTLPLFRRN